MVKKTFFISILLLLALLPLTYAETIQDTSSESFSIQPETTNQESCLQTYFNKPLFQSLFTFMIFLAIVELVLKGFGMWRAVKRDSKVWFILMLILNTAGILPLIYLIITRKRKQKK